MSASWATVPVCNFFIYHIGNVFDTNNCELAVVRREISLLAVQQFLEDKSDCSVTPQTVADIKALAGALLDTVNDKNLALSHQRKTNKYA